VLKEKIVQEQFFKVRMLAAIFDYFRRNAKAKRLTRDVQLGGESASATQDLLRQ
jgi:hypothetical protein